MLVVVVIAVDGGIKVQHPGQQGAHRLVRAAADAAIQLDTRLSQGRLCTAADPAADQDIRVQRAENACQSAVAAAVGVHYLRGEDLSVLRIVDLELPGMAEMLEISPFS